MKTYTVNFGGRGADLYIHKINEEQKSKLKEMDLEDSETSDRKSTRLNSSHIPLSRMPSSA